MNPAKALVDLIFPRSCVHCSNTIEDSPYDFICADCSKDIYPCLPPACKTCGYPFWGAMAGPKVCPHCCELNPVFDQGKALFLAKGPGRSLLHELKYHNGFYALKDLAQMVATTPHYLEYIQNAVLIPVPLHPAKQRERGFNQSEKLARMLANATTGSSRVENLLIRTVFTQTQTRLNQAERHQNVKNAFALTPDTVLIPDKQYIIVDDVFTTGSTLNACACVLRKAGATQLKVVTIGHG
jgi:competence protein ComFC